MIVTSRILDRLNDKAQYNVAVTLGEQILAYVPDMIRQNREAVITIKLTVKDIDGKSLMLTGDVQCASTEKHKDQLEEAVIDDQADLFDDKD